MFEISAARDAINCLQNKSTKELLKHFITSNNRHQIIIIKIIRKDSKKVN